MIGTEYLGSRKGIGGLSLGSLSGLMVPNAGWTPERISSLYRWLDIGGGTGMYSDAGTAPAILNGQVYRLAARNDPAKYLDQSISSKQPLLKQGANGIWYLEPDGTDDFLQTTSGTLSQVNTIAFVWIPSGAAAPNNNAERVVDGGSGTRQLIDGNGLGGSKTWQYYAGTSVINSGSSYTNGLPYRVIAEFNGASTKLIVNGTDVATGSTPGSTGITGLTLFTDNAGSTSTAAAGKLMQYCDFSTALSASEKLDLDAWLLTQIPTQYPGIRDSFGAVSFSENTFGGL